MYTNYPNYACCQIPLNLYQNKKCNPSKTNNISVRLLSSTKQIDVY